MTPPARRRIILGLEASEACRDYLQAAVDLARLLDADLFALFREDPDVLTAAELPVTRELPRLSGEWRQLSSEALARQHVLQARVARQMFEDLTRAAAVVGEFQTLQGRRAELLRFRREGDILWVNHRATLTRVPVTATRYRDHLYVLVSDSPAGHHTRELARLLMPRGYRRFTLLVPEGLAVDPGWIDPARPATVETLTVPVTTEAVLRHVDNRASSTVLLPDDAEPALDSAALLNALERVRAEVLLVH